MRRSSSPLEPSSTYLFGIVRIIATGEVKLAVYLSETGSILALEMIARLARSYNTDLYLSRLHLELQVRDPPEITANFPSSNLMSFLPLHGVWTPFASYTSAEREVQNQNISLDVTINWFVLLTSGSAFLIFSRSCLGSGIQIGK